MKLNIYVQFVAILLALPTGLSAQEGRTYSFRVEQSNPLHIREVAFSRPPDELVRTKQAELERHYRPIDLNQIISKIAGQEEVTRFKRRSMEVHSRAVPPAASHPITNVALDQNDVSFIQRPIGTFGMAGTVCEPSAAISKSGQIFATGNWFAAFSSDNGESFSFINPDSALPSSGFRFCCDQVVHYVDDVAGTGKDLMIWFLQYSDNGSENIFRIAVASEDELQNQMWKPYEFSPTDLDSQWTNEWFDYADLAVNDEYLFITTNVFRVDSVGGGYERAVIVRLPLEKLLLGDEFDAEYFATDQAFSLRPTQGAKDTMYFGSHDFAQFESGIKLYSWKNEDTGPNSVKVKSFNNSTDGLDTWLNNNNNRVSFDRQGNNWLQRADFRMTGAWFADNKVGLAWCAASDAERPAPHVRVALIDVSDPNAIGIVGQPHIYHSEFAFAYPAMSINGDGRVGVSVAYGGGGAAGKNPAHAVGFFDGTGWELTEVAEGTHGPVGEMWGDYLTTRPHPTKDDTWVATGFVLQGTGNVDGIRVHIAEFRENTPPGERLLLDSLELIESVESSADKLEQELQVLRQKIQRIKDQISGKQ